MKYSERLNEGLNASMESVLARLQLTLTTIIRAFGKRLLISVVCLTIDFTLVFRALGANWFAQKWC